MKFSSHIMFEDSDHKQAVVAVTSDKCFYRVAIQGDKVTLVGPGVEHEVEGVIPSSISSQAKAILATILLEEGELL